MSDDNTPEMKDKIAATILGAGIVAAAGYGIFKAIKSAANSETGQKILTDLTEALKEAKLKNEIEARKNSLQQLEIKKEQAIKEVKQRLGKENKKKLYEELVKIDPQFKKCYYYDCYEIDDLTPCRGYSSCNSMFCHEHSSIQCSACDDYDYQMNSDDDDD